MKKLAIFVVLTVALLLVTVPAFAATPVDPEDPNLVMYAATVYDNGTVVPVKMGPYAGWEHAQRLCPANALGEFDAMPGAASFNERFFGVASREWTEYRFDDRFMNVDGVPDIEFCEVTWSSGNSWHVEAVKVYLTGATVRNMDGDVVAYGATDDGIGYYAGIAWNRTGIGYVSEARRLEITESYLPGVVRDYDSNEFYFSGTFGWTEFNLPAEVVCADGLYLIDITSVVYAEGGAGGTYTSGAGSLVTALNCPIDGPEDVSAVSGYTGNTDGYDLDAIRVYRCICGGDDTATGYGTAILPKGNWFMYNYVNDSVGNNAIPEGGWLRLDIQAGNPKNGTNFIGDLYVYDLADGYYRVDFDMDETVTKNGYMYDIVVVDEHLAISDSMNFTAVPGQDDNWDFGDDFYDADGMFYIFAHFAVEYR